MVLFAEDLSYGSSTLYEETHFMSNVPIFIFSANPKVKEK